MSLNLPDTTAGDEPATVTIGETQYYTQARLAAHLRCSVRTLHRWHAQRVGPPRITRNRVILYKVATVSRWLEEGEEGGQRANTVTRRVQERT